MSEEISQKEMDYDCEDLNEDVTQALKEVIQVKKGEINLREL